MGKSKTALNRWEKILDLAGVPDEDLRNRFAEGLSRAVEGFRKPLGWRIRRVLVDYMNYDPRERFLRLLVCADFKDGDEQYFLGRALSTEVFVPICMDLKIHLPCDLITPDKWDRKDFGLSEVALLFAEPS